MISPIIADGHIDGFAIHQHICLPTIDELNDYLLWSFGTE